MKLNISRLGGVRTGLGAIAILAVGLGIHQTMASSSSAATPNGSPSAVSTPTLAATPLPEPTMQLSNSKINDAFASQGIYLFTPMQSDQPSLSATAAAAVVNGDSTYADAAKTAPTLAVFQYAKLGRAPVLAWIFDVSPSTPESCDLGPSHPPGYSPTPCTYGVVVVDAQSGDAREGQLIFGVTGG